MLKIFDFFSPRAKAATTQYPYGAVKDESLPDANDGTPLAAAWANDYEGFSVALLARAGLVPSGNPDTAIASQRLEALLSLINDIKGTAASEVRVNSQNDSRFVQHTEVVNNLTSTDTDKPASAAMVKALKDQQIYRNSIKLAGTSLGGTGGEIIVTREGNLVNLAGSISHGSTGEFSTLANLPSWATPLTTQSSLYSNINQYIKMVKVYPSGGLEFLYTDYSGVGKVGVTTYPICITYTVL